MQKITVKLPHSLAVLLEEHTRNSLEERRRKSAPISEPPISQLEWLSKTPEGKQFTHECMCHKYSKLSQADLNKLIKQKYYATFGLSPRKPGRPKIGELPNFFDARSEIIVDILADYFGIDVQDSPVKLVINNK